jgi:hypothetical protein
LVAESPCGLPVPVSFSERPKMLIDFALRKSAFLQQNRLQRLQRATYTR